MNNQSQLIPYNVDIWHHKSIEEQRSLIERWFEMTHHISFDNAAQRWILDYMKGNIYMFPYFVFPIYLKTTAMPYTLSDRSVVRIMSQWFLILEDNFFKQHVVDGYINISLLNDVLIQSYTLDMLSNILLLMKEN